jgi:hypothetical protein
MLALVLILAFAAYGLGLIGLGKFCSWVSSRRSRSRAAAAAEYPAPPV